MTRSFIDLCLPPALPVLVSPGYLHGNGINHMSPGNQFKSPYSEATRPIYVQSPDFTAVRSFHHGNSTERGNGGFVNDGTNCIPSEVGHLGGQVVKYSGLYLVRCRL